MTSSTSQTPCPTDTLRRRAEERLEAEPPEGPPPLAEVELRRLVHELQVHKVELELVNDELRRVNAELTEALSRVKLLSGILPICCGCKRIRDDKGEWRPVEVYVGDHSQAQFSHSICPECLPKLYPPKEWPELPIADF